MGDEDRAEEERPDEEQGREDREPEVERRRQEGLPSDQGLDRGRDQGAQGARREGLRRGEEGDAPVQEGEGVLRPVSTSSLPNWRCAAAPGREALPRPVRATRVLLSFGPTMTFYCMPCI